jgi:L-amino acid N-acyltransferase YncA
MMHNQLRIAEITDLPAIVNIYNQTIASRMVTADITPIQVEEKIAWFEQHSAQHRPLWVLENDTNEIIAWMSFQSFYGRPAYNATVEISIYIDENYRNQKIGNYLLQYALSHAKEYNIETILGFIFANNTPSIALFQKYGFVVWGHLPEIAQLDDQKRDLLIMGRKV